MKRFEDNFKHIAKNNYNSAINLRLSKDKNNNEYIRLTYC